MGVYTYSDVHFGHKNVIKYSSRPFENVEEMNKKILLGLEKIPRRSTLYFVGDLGFKSGDRMRYLEKIHERKIFFHWILGNHDRGIKAEERKLVVSINDIMNISLSGQPMTFCHYPMVSFHKSHYGAYQIHGHHHTDVSALTPGKRLNVCVDVLKNDFMPVSIEYALELLDKKEDNWDYIAHKKLTGETE